MADSLPEIEFITRDIIQKALNEKEKLDDIFVKDFTVTPGSAKGDNFVGVILAVCAITQEGQEEKQHKLIVKTTSKNEPMRDWTLKKTNVFTTEVMVYARVIPDMIEFQKQKGIEPMGPNVAQHYYSNVDENKGIIVLEDLREHLYMKKANIPGGFDRDHCMLVMKELAIFHATSWAMKKATPNMTEQYPDLFRDGLFDTEVHPFLLQSLKATVALVKARSDREDVKLGVGKLLEMNLYEVIKKQIEPVEPYAAICHGDAWGANLLFKYNENSEVATPIDLKLVDFQISRYALPTTDLAYFFHMCTTRDIRQSHQTELLRHYHASFMKCLNTLDMEFPEFTFDVLEQLYLKSTLFGILSACMLLPTCLTVDEDAARFDKSETYEDFLEHTQSHLSRWSQSSRKNDLISERMVGVIEDAIALNFI